MRLARCLPTILVADDRPRFAHEVRSLVGPRGRVDEATDWASARAMLSKTPPNVLLLDLDFGGREGIDLFRELEHLLQIARTTTFGVALRTDEARVARARDEGLENILRKPFSGEDTSRLLRAVRDATPPYLVVRENVGVLSLASSATARVLGALCDKEIDELAEEGIARLVLFVGRDPTQTSAREMGADLEPLLARGSSLGMRLAIVLDGAPEIATTEALGLPNDVRAYAALEDALSSI